MASAAFSPGRWAEENPCRFISPRELILPNNALATGLPLYFEGRLQDLVREIGFVHVHLELLASAERLAEGVVCFQAAQDGILRGPATVKLAYSFHVEKLPPTPPITGATSSLPASNSSCPYRLRITQSFRAFPPGTGFLRRPLV
jgi:hypothetical protein